MTTPSSLGGESGTEVLTRISTHFDAIASQMSTVAEEFVELRRLVESPSPPAEQPRPSPVSPPDVPGPAAFGPPGPAFTPPGPAAHHGRPMHPAYAPQVSTAPPPRFPAGPYPQRPPFPPPGQPASAPPPRPAGPPMSERLAAAAERGLVGKILAAAGVGITLIGVALLLVLAAQAGILRPEFRVAGGAVLAGALVGAGMWLRSRADGRIGAVALTATGIAAGYLDVLAVTKIYGWLHIVVGLAVAAVVAAAGLVLAHRWRSEHLALMVVVPLIALAPVLTDGLDTTLIAFMVVLAAATSWVQIGRDWIWLHAVRLAAPTLPLTLVGIFAATGIESQSGYGLAFVVSVVVVMVLGFGGGVLALPGTRYREIVAGLAAATTIPVLFAGAVLATPAAVALQAGTALAAIALVAVNVAVGEGGRYALPDVVSQIWTATSLVLLFIAIQVTFDGTVAISAVLGLAIITGFAARSWTATSRTLLVGASLLWAIGFAALLDDAPPYVLADARLLESKASFAVIVASILGAAGAAVIAHGWARVTDGRAADLAYGATALVGVYAVTAVSVTAGILVAGSDGFLGGHVIATTCWVVLGGAALAYARRHTGTERTAAVSGGLILVAAAMAKLFLFDLATLDGIFRVIVFIVTGLILLGLGAWYARALQDVSGPPSTG